MVFIYETQIPKPDKETPITAVYMGAFRSTVVMANMHSVHDNENTNIAGRYLPKLHMWSMNFGEVGHSAGLFQ